MVSYARLAALHRAVNEVVASGVAGDLVECGVARGGSAALMGLTLRALGARDRGLYLFDTFEGLPCPTANDPDYDRAIEWVGKCRGELDEVWQLFRELRLPSECRFIKGLFQDTLPASSVGPIAVLHIDGDWYDSTYCCLTHFYDRVSSGGIVQIDDYGDWQGARKAVDDFLAARGLKMPLRYIDQTGRWLRKP
jgi:hypothetical protein